MTGPFPSTPYQYKVLRLALKEAYANNQVFTRKSFALKNGLAENRHTAAALDAMVSDGLLYRMRVEFPDSRDRLVYSRPPESQKMEVLNRYWQEVRQFVNDIYSQEKLK